MSALDVPTPSARISVRHSHLVTLVVGSLPEEHSVSHVHEVDQMMHEHPTPDHYTGAVRWGLATDRAIAKAGVPIRRG